VRWEVAIEALLERKPECGEKKHSGSKKIKGEKNTKPNNGLTYPLRRITWERGRLFTFSINHAIFTKCRKAPGGGPSFVSAFQ